MDSNPIQYFSLGLSRSFPAEKINLMSEFHQMCSYFSSMSGRSTKMRDNHVSGDITYLQWFRISKY